MGTDIIIMREARIDGEWKSCEKTIKEFNEEWVKEYSHLLYDDCDENASHDIDVGRNYQTMGLLSGMRYSVSDSVIDYPNGLPSDLSLPVKLRIDYTEKCNEKWNKQLTDSLSLCFVEKTQFYNCTFKDIKDFLEKWRTDLIETGYYPVDFIDEDAESKLLRFERGIYKKDLEKKMEFMLKTFDSPETNPLQNFLNILNNEKCNGEFKGDLNTLKDEDKRIIFWYSF